VWSIGYNQQNPVMAKSSIYFLTFTVSLNNVSGQPPIIFQIDFLSSFVPFPLNIQIDCFIWLFLQRLTRRNNGQSFFDSSNVRLG
jgi:hypothetical protein